MFSVVHNYSRYSDIPSHKRVRYPETEVEFRQAYGGFSDFPRYPAVFMPSVIGPYSVSVLFTEYRQPRRLPGQASFLVGDAEIEFAMGNLEFYSDGNCRFSGEIFQKVPGSKAAVRKESNILFLRCEHDFERVESGRSYSASRCRKCGYQFSVDSSG